MRMEDWWWDGGGSFYPAQIRKQLKVVSGMTSKNYPEDQHLLPKARKEEDSTSGG